MARRILPVIFLSACLAVTVLAAPPSASVENFLAALYSKDVDRTLKSLSDIKRSRYQGDVLPLLKAFWNRDTQALPNVSQTMLDSEIVRIHVADVLVQAYHNGLIEIPVSDVHGFARSLLKSPDKEVVAATLFVLAQVDDPRDVRELEAIALESKGYLFRSAVVALAMMCNADANAALGRIGGRIDDAEGKDFVRDTAKKLSKSQYCVQRDNRPK